MKKLMTALALVLAAGAMSVQAADEKKPTAQQNKMTTCNKEAGEKSLAGDERKAFMKTCLSAAPAKPESKMAMCNKKTAGMNKEDRAKAQSECMKAPA